MTADRFTQIANFDETSTAKRIPGTSGGVGMNNRPTSNTPTSFGIQPRMSYYPSGGRWGGDRDEPNKVHIVDVFDNQASGDRAANLELVAPLGVFANRRPGESSADEERGLLRKAKTFLDKLTMEEFDSISDQIVEWANRSETEGDGRTLIHITGLIFEKAIDEAARSEVYARLCSKMVETISPNVQDDLIRGADGKPITGGRLFHKYLLNRCQEDFERDWTAKGVGAATKASIGVASKGAAETSREVEPYSREYYAAQKAKRQRLGLIQFIGELYKLHMLTERIVHECIKKLLGNVDNPEEEEIDSLCRLLTTVGKLLDHVKARAHMDIYFTRIKELGKSAGVAPHIQLTLRDLIELRERKWIPKTKVAAPTTVAQVTKQRIRAEKESANRTLTVSLDGEPAWEPQTDGWPIAGGPTPWSPSKTKDLLDFDKIKFGTVETDPRSVWAGKKDGWERDSTLTRSKSSSTTLANLGRDREATPATGSKPSWPSNRKISIDFGAGGTPKSQVRKKLQLLPRSKPVEEENEANSGSTEHPKDKIPVHARRGAPQLCKPRRSEFYFESGNVVFVCGNTSFRVQSDLLSNNSQVLSDMLRPARLDGGHLSDGCPCVHLPDSAEDFGTLLKVFYIPGFPHRHKTPDFTTFSSLLRMATKYQFQEIRSQILLDLLPAYPTKLLEYEGSSCLGEAVFGSPLPHPNSVLDLFVTCQVAFALPFAYYRVCIAGDPTSPSTSAEELALLHNTPGTLQAVLRGQAQLKTDEVQLARSVAFRNCTAWGHCLGKSPADRVLFFDWIHPEVTTRGGILERGDILGLGYCSQCSQTAQKELLDAKKDTWENLPSYFGLPPWEDTVDLPP